MYTTVPDGEESCFIVDAVDDAGNSAFLWTGEAQIVTAWVDGRTETGWS
ncbi:hypothetical protein [Streptomyces fagopyri]